MHRNLVTVNLSPEMMDAYDYLEAVEVFKNYLENYATFLDDMIKTAGLYRSPQTGMSFVDILDSVENIRKIDLYEAESIIKVSLETKQKDALLKKYQYRLLSLEKEMQKKQQEAASARALLDEVWKQEKVGQPWRSENRASLPRRSSWTGRCWRSSRQRNTRLHYSRECSMRRWRRILLPSTRSFSRRT